MPILLGARFVRGRRCPEINTMGTCSSAVYIAMLISHDDYLTGNLNDCLNGRKLTECRMTRKWITEIVERKKVN